MKPTPEPSLFTGITRGRWTGLLLLWISVGILFLFIYSTARRSILNEVRAQAMGVAVATAAGIDPADLALVREPGDMDTPAFLRLQAHLDRVKKGNPDVRYAYTMRRAPGSGAVPSDLAYVVDASAQDINGNGVLDPDEMSEDPGRPYDASDLPEMLAAWDRPAADSQITADPPYPDLLSGYAPIRGSGGRTVAIIGVDITADTVSRKLLAVRIVTLCVAVVMTLLLAMVILLYYQQREALERNTLLSQELASRNEMLRGANAELSKHHERSQQELRLAESVQLGFLPKTFPRQDRIRFDKFYVTCEILGGDLFDVFSVGRDQVALYVADVAGHGVSAALISGMLKMAVSSARDKSSIATGHLHADLLEPDRVLATLNEMLVKEIPETDFITVVYATLDLTTDTFTLASGGHPPPLHYSAKERRAQFWTVPTGTALGLVEGQTYPVVQEGVREGDKILFYTDGLIEAMNPDGEEFGEARVLDVVNHSGQGEPSDILRALRNAVDEHRAGNEISDDFSLLIAEIQ